MKQTILICDGCGLSKTYRDESESYRDSSWSLWTFPGGKQYCPVCILKMQETLSNPNQVQL